MENEQVFKIGDWVKGKTKKGALIHGFLYNLDPKSSKVQLKVVASDHDRVIGNIVSIDKHNIEKLDSSFTWTEKQLRGLIDLALTTGDKEWFMDLSAQLKNRSKHEHTAVSGRFAPRNHYEEAKD